MIQEFSVTNFLSFKDKETISFEATKDKKNIDELTVEVKKGVRLLKMAVVFGANASGKTNLLSAIDAVWALLFSSNALETVYKPFETSKGQPIMFEFVFWANGVKYVYETKFSNSEIIYEKLQYAPNGILSLLYKRESIGVTYGSTINIQKRDRAIISSDLQNNQTVLSLLKTKNINNKELNILYNWIKAVVNEFGAYSNIIEVADESTSNEKLKKFILQLLCKADFNIIDYKVLRTSPISKEMLEKEIDGTDHENLDDSVKDAFIAQMNNRKELYFMHSTSNFEFELPVGLESIGTIRYFLLARLLYDLAHSESISLIDEIEDSLHEDLLLHYLTTFIEHSTNSQLIFTTHNRLLLDQDFIRRDMVWFVEKLRDTAISQLSRASDYGLHKNVSLYNAHKIGKIGANPIIGSVYINREDN